MKQIGGVWLPDHETHMVGWMQQRNQVVQGKLTYQYHKLEAALAWVKAWRSAIDVGAHCGLWSMHLAQRFEVLHAFEPVKEHRQCWERNCEGLGGALMYPVALGEQPGNCAIRTTPTSSGNSLVDTSAGNAGDVTIRRLDDLDLQDVDFIKLDCEGYELFALRGGEALLKRCRPCVIVEQKPGRAQKFGLPETAAVEYLQGLGAVLRREMSGDFILTWD